MNPRAISSHTLELVEVEEPAASATFEPQPNYMASRQASTAASSILDLKAMVAQRRATGAREEKKQPRASSSDVRRVIFFQLNIMKVLT